MFNLIDSKNIPIFNANDLTNLFYTNQFNENLDIQVESNHSVSLWNKHCDSLNIKNLSAYKDTDESKLEFDKRLSNDYLMPDHYKNFDIEKYLLQCCKTPEETKRVTAELAAFKDKNLLNLLRYINYLTHILRANKILWGVGRGSSVASFVLYLLGINRINPLKYNLDWQEFLR